MLAFFPLLGFKRIMLIIFRYIQEYLSEGFTGQPRLLRLEQTVAQAGIRTDDVLVLQVRQTSIAASISPLRMIFYCWLIVYNPRGY